MVKQKTKKMNPLIIILIIGGLIVILGVSLFFILKSKSSHKHSPTSSTPAPGAGPVPISTPGACCRVGDTCDSHDNYGKCQCYKATKKNCFKDNNIWAGGQGGKAGVRQCINDFCPPTGPYSPPPSSPDLGPPGSCCNINKDCIDRREGAAWDSWNNESKCTDAQGTWSGDQCSSPKSNDPGGQWQWNCPDT